MLMMLLEFLFNAEPLSLSSSTHPQNLKLISKDWLESLAVYSNSKIKIEVLMTSVTLISLLLILELFQW